MVATSVCRDALAEAARLRAAPEAGSSVLEAGPSGLEEGPYFFETGKKKTGPFRPEAGRKGSEAGASRGGLGAGVVGYLLFVRDSCVRPLLELFLSFGVTTREG